MRCGGGTLIGGATWCNQRSVVVGAGLGAWPFRRFPVLTFQKEDKKIIQCAWYLSLTFCGMQRVSICAECCYLLLRLGSRGRSDVVQLRMHPARSKSFREAVSIGHVYSRIGRLCYRVGVSWIL